MEDRKTGLPKISRNEFLSDNNLIGKVFSNRRNHQELLIVHSWNEKLYVDDKMRNTTWGIPINYHGNDCSQAAYGLDIKGNYYEIRPIIQWSYITELVNDTNEQIFSKIRERGCRYVILKEMFETESDNQDDFATLVGTHFKPTIIGFDINLIDEEYDYYHPHRWDQSTHDYMIPILLSYCVCYREFPFALATFFKDDYETINSLISSFDDHDIRDYLF